MANMNQDDWEKWLNENSQADGNYVDYETPSDPEVEDQELNDANEISIKGIKRESEKAIFFIIENEFDNEEGNIIGTWIPKSLIIVIEKESVFVKDWFEIKKVIWEGN